MTSREILQGVVEKIGKDSILNNSLPGSGSDSGSFLSSASDSLKNIIKSIDPIGEEELAKITLEENLEISAPSEAGVVTVEYRSKSPELAQMVVVEWIELFQNLYLRSTRTRGAFDFFVEQDEILKSDLENAREELSSAKNRFGIVTIEGQQRIVEQQIQTIELELLAVDAGLSESVTRVRSLTNLAGSIQATTVTQDVTGLPNQARDSMRSRLYDLEVEEKRLSALFTDDHPFVQAVRDQLESSSVVVKDQEGERKEITRGLNTIRQVVDEKLALEQAAVQALTKRAEALAAQKKRLIQQLSELNKHEQVVANLNRKVEILEERYRAHSERFEQARLDEALEEQRISSINVVQSPSLEYRPISPRKRICAVLGLVAAIAAAVGLPMWIESDRFAKLHYKEQGEPLPDAPKPAFLANGESQLNLCCCNSLQVNLLLIICARLEMNCSPLQW
ncbi:MAG: hypothetical protein MJA83_02140, partial [Gammaproteobacteria bacterium]|nr:hypothetical protein [Gammaproteobacteria bacterium]